MNRLDSKEKGDLGVAAVILDLQKHGFSICLPMSEHLGFDLIAVDKQYNLSKVSVKYRRMYRGLIEISLRTVSSNTKGHKTKFADITKINGYAVYCPETGKCYYVSCKTLGSRSSCMYLRVENTTNPSINYAENFRDPSVLFSEDSTVAVKEL